MSDIVSSWSPGQAVAPCLTCQAGLCAEHGPARVETTTGGPSVGALYVFYEGCEDRAYTVEVRPDGPVLTDSTGATFVRVSTAPPAPAAEATGEMSDSVVAALIGMIAPRRGEDSDDRYSRERAIKELLDAWTALRTRAREAEERAEKTTEHLLNSVARAVRRGDELERERDAERYMRGVNQRAAENAEKAVAVVVNERDEAREQLRATTERLQDAEKRCNHGGEHSRCQCDAELIERLNAQLVRMTKGRDMWMEVAGNTERERVEAVARYEKREKEGDELAVELHKAHKRVESAQAEAQAATARAEEAERKYNLARARASVTERLRVQAEERIWVQVERADKAERERDEARGQRDAEGKKRDDWKAVAENTERDRVAQLAAANGRAEAYQKDRDLTGYRLAAAEAEVKRLRDVLHLDRSGLANALNRVRDTARGYRWIPAGEWGSYDYTGQTMETLRKEIGWMLDGVEKTAAEALGQSGDLAHAECCGGERKEIPVERENAALRERCRRLVAAGDRLVFRIVNPDARFDLEAWAAAKGALDAPAADGGEG